MKRLIVIILMFCMAIFFSANCALSFNLVTDSQGQVSIRQYVNLERIYSMQYMQGKAMTKLALGGNPNSNEVVRIETINGVS